MKARSVKGNAWTATGVQTLSSDLSLEALGNKIKILVPFPYGSLSKAAT